MSGVSKFAADRNQRVLLDLVNKPGNGQLPYSFTFERCIGLTRTLYVLLTDVCADCKARAPRWASHNLGIFIWYVGLG